MASIQGPSRAVIAVDGGRISVVRIFDFQHALDEVLQRTIGQLAREKGYRCWVYSLKNCSKIQYLEGFSVEKTSPAKLPDSYELLGLRLQRAINSPAAQRAKSALLQRLPDDRAEDWDQIVEELGDTDNVTLAYRDDGHDQVFWKVPKED